jgi:riboflavin kinase / FMN adenylyltransferase
MQHYRSLDQVHLEQSWLTIGAFDGVHRGHQAIIYQLTAGARAHGAPAVVLTFHPHPASILRGRTGRKYLTSPEQRARILGELGVDIVITHPFDENTANQPGRDFLSHVITHLNFQSLWVGDDFAMGKGRDTNTDALREISYNIGFELNVVSKVSNGDQVISSSHIRGLLQEGNVVQAATLLGRPYEVAGKVIPGDGRGRTIGVPTANLDVWEEQVIPANGVYACMAFLENQPYLAAVNIGIRPTFDGSPDQVHVEAHLLDADIDLYGKTLRLGFASRLRGEQKFSGIDSLVSQIQQDISQARRILQS